MDNPLEVILQTPAAKQWRSIGIKHHHGIALPLFSLHSEASCGIGEYPDLLQLIPWCRHIGLDVIQLLPLNDTGIDISPYSALSSNALNPIHLGLSRLPFVAGNADLQRQSSELKRYNNSQRIQYPEVRQMKEQFLRAYYQQYASGFVARDNYQSFKKRYPWLKGYALFKAIKIARQWEKWEEWPQELKALAACQHIPNELAVEVEFQIFVQYLCFLQLEEVKQYASQNSVLIKGDIPILINRESADVWFDPTLFHLDLGAGAPPDMYAEEGQKWGFPIYNWDALESQRHRWWIERLKAAEHCYHLYRIDHIVGFYRIWSIPLDMPAKQGFFVPKEQEKWIPQGEKIMQLMLANCSMLPIGEDLGVIPPEVRISLRHLGICGTKVMRWERNWNTDKTFIDPREYLPISMTTVSTHDSETLQLWWMNQPEESQAYADSRGWQYSHELTHWQRLDILKASHHSGSLFHINLLQEYLALIAGMTWPDPKDERINIPGIINDTNWTYRFRPSVEEITSNALLKQAITDIII